MRQNTAPENQLFPGTAADQAIAACTRNPNAGWAEIAAVLRPQIRPWPDGPPRGIFR